MDRDWLARRIEIEAWAYANADHLTRDLCLGCVLGFLGLLEVVVGWPR